MAKTKHAAAAHSADFPLAPRPRTSILNVFLCVLNVLATVAFLYIMLLDLEKRREWSRASFLTEATVKGIPFKEAGTKFMGVDETMPKPVLNSDELESVHKTVQAGGGPLKGRFVAQKEYPPPRIDPKNFDAENLGKIFGNQQNPVATLEDEMSRVKNALLKDITAAAVKAAADAKTPEDKRKQLETVLLPQAVDSFQVLELDKFIRNLNDDRLDELLVATYERRMILDILLPVEVVRPGDVKLPYVKLARVRDVKDLKLQELQEKLTLRLTNAVEDTYNGELYLIKDLAGKPRPATEKHDNIAFLLFTIAHTLKPDEKLLYESGPARTQTVIGLYAFAEAAKKFKTAVASIEVQLVERIRHDRDGSIIFLDNEKLDRTRAFTARYGDMIRAIREQISAIDNATLTLKLKEAQRDRAKNTYFEGKAEVAEKEKELRVERAKTAKLLVDLQAIQARLFRSQLELATAAIINEDLHRQVEAAERELARIQGVLPTKGKTP